MRLYWQGRLADARGQISRARSKVSAAVKEQPKNVEAINEIVSLRRLAAARSKISRCLGESSSTGKLSASAVVALPFPFFPRPLFCRFDVPFDCASVAP